MARRKIAESRTLVTGASSGIGREICLRLVRQGARVLATARREDRLAQLSDACRDLAGEIRVLPGDITEPTHRQALLDCMKAEFGGLDILINNAGISGIGPFLEADESRLRKIMEVNFFAPLELIRSAGPLLREGNKPIIVNVSSVLGHRSVPKKTEYCASKFALHGFSDALRCELVAEKIDVLIVSPSTTSTEIFDQAMGDKNDLPWRNLGPDKPARVASATVRAIRRGRHEVILTPGGKLLVWADRLCPPFVNRMVAYFG